MPSRTFLVYRGRTIGQYLYENFMTCGLIMNRAFMSQVGNIKEKYGVVWLSEQGLLNGPIHFGCRR